MLHKKHPPKDLLRLDRTDSDIFTYSVTVMAPDAAEAHELMRDLVGAAQDRGYALVFEAS